MPWDDVDVDADYLAWAAEDKPLVGVRNVLNYATAIEWKTMVPASASDGDEARLHDGLTGLLTAPTGTAATAWQIQCTLSGAPDLDFIALQFAESGDDYGGTITITVEIADNAAFTTRLQQIASFSITGASKRGADVVLGPSTAQVYTDVVYLRILITTTNVSNPQMAEAFIGTRIQLANYPEWPYDNKGLSGETVIHRAHDGSQYRYVHHKGKRSVVANLRPWVDARADDIESIYTLSDYGNGPMIWIDEPSATPAAFNLVHSVNPSLLMPHVGPHERNVTLDLEEQGPLYKALEV